MYAQNTRFLRTRPLHICLRQFGFLTCFTTTTTTTTTTLSTLLYILINYISYLYHSLTDSQTCAKPNFSTSPVHFFAHLYTFKLFMCQLSQTLTTARVPPCSRYNQRAFSLPLRAQDLPSLSSFVLPH